MSRVIIDWEDYHINLKEENMNKINGTSWSQLLRESIQFKGERGSIKKLWTLTTKKKFKGSKQWTLGIIKKCCPKEEEGKHCL